MAKNINTNTIAYRLYTARKSKHLTQQELADLCGVSRQAIYEYEKGFYAPKLDSAGKLSKVLEVSLDYLCFGVTYNIPLTRNYVLTYKDLMKSFIHLKNTALFNDSLENNTLILKTNDENFIKLYNQIENINAISDSLLPNTYTNAIDDLLNKFDFPITE